MQAAPTTIGPRRSITNSSSGTSVIGPGLVVQRRRIEAREVLAHALDERLLVLAIVRPHLGGLPERHRVDRRPAELEAAAVLGHAVDARPVRALHQAGPLLPARIAGCGTR